jgi:hypothetical protein
MAQDERDAEEYGISANELKDSWSLFVGYCLRLVKQDFKDYIIQPDETYRRMVTETRANIQRVRCACSAASSALCLLCCIL